MPDNLAQFIAEHSAAKRGRYEEFGKLMEKAVRAGDAAAGSAVIPGAPRERGAAWVKLADGRSTFARFARERCEGQWLRGSREMGNYLPAPFEFLDQALAWARAVGEELCRGDVEVTVGHRAIGEVGR